MTNANTVFAKLDQKRAAIERWVPKHDHERLLYGCLEEARREALKDHDARTEAYRATGLYGDAYASLELAADTLICHTHTAQDHLRQVRAVREARRERRLATRPDLVVRTTADLREGLDRRRRQAEDAVINDAIRKYGQVFAVVTFGSPSRAADDLADYVRRGWAVEDGLGRVAFLHSEAAYRYAESCIGTGSCTNARVATCWSARGFEDANIAEIAGEGWTQGVDLSRARRRATA